MVKCLRFREKREIASLIFAFARGFTWFASGSPIYCVLLNAIVEKNSQFAIIRLSHLKSVLRYNVKAAGRFSVNAVDLKGHIIFFITCIFLYLTHARREGYSSCLVCVCLSVCMYVCPNTLFWQYAQLEV